MSGIADLGEGGERGGDGVKSVVVNCNYSSSTAFTRSDAAIGLHNNRLRFEMVGALHLIRGTTFEFANGGAQVRILVRLESLEALNQTPVGPNSAILIAASLQGSY